MTRLRNLHSALLFCLGISISFSQCSGTNTVSMWASGAHVTTLSRGELNACVVTDSNHARCWGFGGGGANGHGNMTTLGDNSSTEIASAGDINVGLPVRSISAGNTSVCALTTSGTVRCWGVNTDGQLGLGHTTNVGITSSNEIANNGDVNIGGTALQVVMLSVSACALLDTGKIRCWGSGDDGRLGYGDTNSIGKVSANEIVQKGDLPFDDIAIQISGIYKHVCALFAGGGIRCWGHNEHGKLGYGHTNAIGDTPGEIAALPYVALGAPAKKVIASYHGTCALLESGQVKCWGMDYQTGLSIGGTGDIGDGAGEIETLSVVPLPGLAKDVACGNGNCIALLVDNTLWGWGSNNAGELGLGNTTHVAATPVGSISITAAGAVPVLSASEALTLSVSSVSMGGAMGCALISNGAVRCWGVDGGNGLGYGDLNPVGDGVGSSIVTKGNVNIGDTVLITPNHF